MFRLSCPARRRITPAAFAIVLVLGLAGCREERVSYYEVPRENPPAPPALGGMGAGADNLAPPAPPTGPRLVWDKPAAWTEKAASAMRLASYEYVGPDGATVDVSVTSFPDAAGGLLANINRWRGQVGLPDVPGGDLDGIAERAEIAGLVSRVVNFAGTPPGSDGSVRILGAIVPLNGSSWFFKVMGPDAAVLTQAPAFRDLLASMRAVTPSVAMPGSPAADPHAGVDMSQRTMTANAGAVPPPPSSGGFTFNVPEGWVAQPTTQFRVVNLLIPGPATQKSEFYVTPLSGAAGGELANVNRWRTQLALPPITEAELDAAVTTVGGAAGTFRVYELASTGPALPSGEPGRILAAILKRGDTSWFFKLTGETNHVATLREPFTDFLRSWRFE